MTRRTGPIVHKPINRHREPPLTVGPCWPARPLTWRGDMRCQSFRAGFMSVRIVKTKELKNRQQALRLGSALLSKEADVLGY